MAEPPVQVCVGCKAQPALLGFGTPLCPSCREMLIRYPVPRWLRLAAGLILAVMIYSAATRLPSALQADIAVDRAKIAEQHNNYPAAKSELVFALASYPSAGKILSELTLDASRAGDKRTADDSLQRLTLLAKSDPSQAMALDSTRQQLNAR